MRLGMLMASGEESVMSKGVPWEVPAPVHRLVPGWRTTPERPGSIVKVMEAGARPLDWLYTRAPPVAVDTVNVSLPLPRLLMRSVPEATPRLQLSIARNTAVVAGAR